MGSGATDLSGPMLPGRARIAVPEFFIERFRIPPFLLPIYQAAGVQYGIRWELLAAINEIETDYGRNLNVSSAGALGWMQFMPETWKAYGIDANRDGVADPYNPVDAIFASARYLRAAGATKDVRRAVFAYNHADWYVDSVLKRARLIGALPVDFVSSLTGLTQGRFPVDAQATYRSSRSSRSAGAGSGRRTGIDVVTRTDARVVAVNDGRIVRMGSSARLGRFVSLQDVHGNTYTYGHLGSVARTYSGPRPPRTPRPRPRRTHNPADRHGKERLFAHPSRPAARRAGGARQLGHRAHRAQRRPREPRATGKSLVARALKPGARVQAGTVLGRPGRTVDPGRSRATSRIRFELRPAGRETPRVDPAPVLDGWKLLESSAIHRAQPRERDTSGDGSPARSIGQILLMGKEELQRRVLANPAIELYACGRDDVRAGIVDRRVLAALEYLAVSDLRPTVSSLRCGHGRLTRSGNVSHHSTGDAVDIAAVNGIPVLGNQGRGSATEQVIRRLLRLQGAMKPDQIISLMTFEGADNTFAMGDHADHIHLGWRPLYSASERGARLSAALEPQQWTALIDRLSRIENPSVRLAPSRYAARTAR